MDNKLTFEALKQALEKIKGDCNHKEPFYQITEYWGKCKCGLHDFIMCPPELKQWYDEMINDMPKPDHEPEDVYGIKVYRT